MYQALYRKYRPKDFDSVVGQNPIIKTLKNSIINNSFSHAYMFFGPRGTGKTTVSKIFARNVNCLSPVDGIACGICDACNVSFSKECVDIIEIDAASNNGVDEIRELKSNITLVPSELRFKVYIIDEFHMLSAGAFNALLKTLEEPPEHAIFILATTDPQKVPDTIVSRCQCFSFKRISDIDIKNRLKFVCDKEKIDVDDDVLEKISILSDGGLRDALSSLDKLVAYSGSKITLDDFYEVNGVISDEDVEKFISSIMIGNIQNVLKNIDNFNASGKNLIQILVQIINLSRNLVVDYYLSDKKLDYSIDLLQRFVNLLNEKLFDIKNSGNTKVYIEMFLLKFINDNVLNEYFDSKNASNLTANTQNDVKNLSENIISTKSAGDEKKNQLNDSKVVENVQENIDKNDDDDDFDFNKYMSDEADEDDFDDVSSFQTIPKILNIDVIMDARINNTFATANKEYLNSESSKFELLKNFSFDQEIGYLVNSLLDSKIRVVGENDFIISYDSDGAVNQNLVNIIKLNDVYEKVTGSTKRIAIVSDEKWDKLKNEYISNLKNKVKYELVDEPDIIFEEIKNNDIISNSAVSLFGEDVVEFE